MTEPQPIHAEEYTPDPGEDMRQGRCKPCGLAFRWPYRGRRHGLRLRDAHCPRCGRQLAQTTHMLRSAKWMTINEPLTGVEALKRFPKQDQITHILRHDDDEVFRGTANDALAWLHRNTSFSWDHAFKYEGYTLRPAGQGS